MSSAGCFLEKAIEIVKDAAKNDNEKNYEEAYKQYTSSLEYFILALKYEKNPKSRESIRKKVIEYLERAEYLKKNLPTLQGAKTGTNDIKKEATTRGGADKEELKEAIAASILEPDPNLSWDDVAGLDNAKDALKEAVILPMKFPHFFVGKRTPWKGILLYGPPGTGKSFISRVVSSEAACTFFSVSSSDIVCKWMGESESVARSKKPSIIFIDEIDSICGERSDSENDATRRIKTEILVQMQGVSNSSEGILVIGATNIPWTLDPAVRRRFEKRIYIPLPDYNAIVKILENNLKGSKTTIVMQDILQIAKKLEGYSAADISVIVRDALMVPIRKMQSATFFKKVKVASKDDPMKMVDVWECCSPGERGGIEITWNDLDPMTVKEPEVTLSDLVNACATFKPSSNPEYIKKYEIWKNTFGTD